MSTIVSYAAIQNVQCPFCRAPAGRTCTDAGRYPRSHHAERIEAAEAEQQKEVFGYVVERRPH